MEHLAYGNSDCQLMVWEADQKKRKLNPKTTVSVPSYFEVNVADVFKGKTQSYTVAKIVWRKPQNIEGRDLVKFISST